MYLALRATDGSDGWVALEDLLRFIPAWRRKSIATAGALVSRLSTSAWFAPLIEAEQITRGRYRFRERAVTFVQGRDAANDFVSSLQPMPHAQRATHSQTHRRRIDATELAAYDLLAQYGIYLAPVVDLIVQRIGEPASIHGALEQLLAYKIRATLDKNRGDLVSARRRAERGIAIARRLGRLDELAYLYDQIGGAYYIEGDLGAARTAFMKEIAALTSGKSARAAFHLVGAHRGLAAVEIESGNFAAARTALDESRRLAIESDNQEGLRLVAVYEQRIPGHSTSVEPLDAALVTELPAHHLIARVMALAEAASLLLAKGLHDEGGRLLLRALADARHLGLANEERRLRELAAQHGVTPP